MKYQVELIYESYTVYEIEANSREEAKDMAWHTLYHDAEAIGKTESGQWNINNVIEIENDED